MHVASHICACLADAETLPLKYEEPLLAMSVQNGAKEYEAHIGLQFLQVVEGVEIPPPSTVDCSCVFIVRRGDGRFYCGQTDRLRGCLNRHYKTGKVRGVGRLQAADLVVPRAGPKQRC